LVDALVVVPLPAGPAAPAQPWLYSDGLFINPSVSPAQQALALTVAQAMTTGAGAQALATGGTLLPAARDVDLSAQPLLQGFARQAETAIAMPTRPEMDQVWGYGGDMLIKTLTGLTPPPAIVAETTALINEANGKVAANE
jgi:maltose-binding protein MalE